MYPASDISGLHDIASATRHGVLVVGLTSGL
jgi:hypothetical protein